VDRVLTGEISENAARMQLGGKSKNANVSVLRELLKDAEKKCDKVAAADPVEVQKAKEAQLVAKDRVEDDNVFFNKEFIYGADAIGEAFLTLPHLAVGGFPA
jgi:phage major head subunit gpT-like protein